MLKIQQVTRLTTRQILYQGFIRLSIAVDSPQVFARHLKISLERLVRAVHRGPLYLLGSVVFPQGHGGTVPSAAIQVDALKRSMPLMFGT